MRYYQCSEAICVQIYLCTYYILILHSAYNFQWNWYCYKNHHLVQKYFFQGSWILSRGYRIGYQVYGCSCFQCTSTIAFFRKSQTANTFLETSSSSYSGKGVFNRHWSYPCVYLNLGNCVVQVPVANWRWLLPIDSSTMLWKVPNQHFISCILLFPIK